MERLYAPWRMAYIKADKDKEELVPGATGCIFCDKPQAGLESDRANGIVHRAGMCYAILNAYPYNNGHLMVVPYRHVAHPEELSDMELFAMMRMMTFCTKIISAVMRPDGYNIGMNVGAAAGAGIAAHLHLHIVPRWAGDTNFMPVLADVKVMPELLAQVYDKLRAEIERQLPPVSPAPVSLTEPTTQEMEP